MSIAALVLADAPGADVRVVGLSLAERARRVATRAGAQTVLVARDRAAVADWWRAAGCDRLLVIRATDQMVHTPLVAPLIASECPRAVAVAPPDAAAADVAAGAYAGALIVHGAAAEEMIAALAAGGDDRALGAELLAAGADACAHDRIARHPATTRTERRAAARLLFEVIHKHQDYEITRYLFRPVSTRMTAVLVRTPLTPNQVSSITAVLVVLGCWLTARGSMGGAIAGSAVMLAAAYVDCCDGEIARLKLLSSKFGAWLDTVVDELSQVAYMIALGLHCRQYFGVDYLGHHGLDPWRLAIIVGVVTYGVTIYCVYWNIVVLVGSANSQDYISRFEITPGERPGTARLRPVTTQAIMLPPDTNPVIRWLATYAPYVVRKDFITWGVLVLAIAHLTQVSFGLLVVGGVLSSTVVVIDHARARAQLSELRRRELVLVR
ncbi:MAG: CDP-alcohol phosphatidyltransferase family protein [Myxococcales bacterium]|nr:CDP-alcohol phosphatidyltransferase family protein [Myxococcales bacterium]